MLIQINTLTLDWPKPTISEQQLRDYADAPAETHEIWQANGAGGVTPIHHMANIYDGAVFIAKPKGEA